MSTTVDIPAGSHGPVYITSSVSAKWQQRVSITDNQVNGFNVNWIGVGEGIGIGQAEVKRDQLRSYTITAEHSEDGGNTWVPNQIKVSTIKTRSRPPIVVTTVSTEDGGDNDFDDSVVHFRYTGA